MEKKKSVWKKVLIIIAATAGVFVVVVGSYVLYVVISYSRLKDNIVLSINSPQGAVLSGTDTYKISTFNIGFGAYNHDYSFFMDTGKMLDGTEVSGRYGKARSRNAVLANTNGAISASKAFEADFMFFQEVDIKSTRSYKVNQLEMIKAEFSNYSYSFATNYDSAYLFYPFSDPIGKSKSGIATFSKYETTSATRRRLPLATGFAKYFDLDRCIMISRLPVAGGGELVLINVHLSAYDEGGLIRQQQINMLKELLQTEKDKGNYVIAGGDFNHDIANSSNLFETGQYKPEWVYALDEQSDLPSGFSFAAAVNAPTCRSTDMPYTRGVNYTVVIDGFIISDNIIMSSVTNVDLDFENSDHNPVLLEFRLG